MRSAVSARLPLGMGTAMEHVVVGVDGSADSLRAVEWAAREADRRHLPLKVVHAVHEWLHSRAEGEIEEVRRWMWNNGRQIVDQAVAHAREHAPAVQAADAMAFGDPARALAEEAGRDDLLVVASRGTGRISSLLLGSVALKVVSQSPCPVAVIRGGVEPDREFREIVAGVDGSPAAAEALRFAAEEAALRGARLRVILAWSLPVAESTLVPPFFDLAEIEGTWERTLDEAVRSAGELHPGLDVVRELVTGHPVQALIDASEAADLVVMGSHGRGALAGLFLGSVSHGVLHHAACPVAVIGPRAVDAPADTPADALAGESRRA
ncbi:universal stress protein [Planomonospora corallina]|uniref:Universal stress protein n=1 Tax=Planomonospora corallina TaxID=1806052 RepID=A0ABV8I9Q2_9ACTN